MEALTLRESLLRNPSGFLRGFAESCRDDADLVRRAKHAMAAFPEIVPEFEKHANWLTGLLGGAKSMLPGAGKALAGGADDALGAASKSMASSTLAPAAKSMFSGGASAAATAGANNALKSTARSTLGRIAAPALGGTLGAAGAYQQHGWDPTRIAGGAAFGALGTSVGGRGGGALGVAAAAPTSYLFGGALGDAAVAAKGMVERPLGLGKPGSWSEGFAGPTAPSMRSVDTASTPNALNNAFEMGADGFDKLQSQWGPEYRQTIDKQRSEFFNKARQSGQRLGVPAADMESAVMANTPPVGASLSQHSEAYKQLQNPDIRKAFEQVELPQYEKQLLEQFNSGKPVDPKTVESLLTGRALATAAGKGVAPDELLGQAQELTAKLQSDGQLDPMELNSLVQTPGGQELVNEIATTGTGGQQGVGATLKQFFSQNPMQAGLLMLGVPLALAGLFSTFNGGGMGGILALLAGGGMAAYGAGMFGGGPNLMDMLNAKDMGSRPMAAPGGPGGPAPAVGAAGAPAGGGGRLAEFMQNPQAAMSMLPPEMQGMVTPDMLGDWLQSYQQNPQGALQQLGALGLQPAQIQRIQQTLGSPQVQQAVQAGGHMDPRAAQQAASQSFANAPAAAQQAMSEMRAPGALEQLTSLLPDIGQLLQAGGPGLYNRARGLPQPVGGQASAQPPQSQPFQPSPDREYFIDDPRARNLPIMGGPG